MRVLIVEERQLYGEALQGVLEAEGVEVIGVTTSAEAALALDQTADPDMVLMGTGYFNEDPAPVAAISKRFPNAKVAALMVGPDRQIRQEAKRLGFDACVRIGVAPRDFLRSLMAETDDLHGSGTASTRSARAGDDPVRLMASALTPREREVLLLLVEGASGKEMAKRLGLRPNTVRSHVQNLLNKMQVHSRAEAAACAVDHGIIRRPRMNFRGPTLERIG